LSGASLDRIARAQKRLGNKRVDVRALHAEVEEIFRENGLA
jgi:beta-N-acetylhexosaminidase